MTVHEHTVLFAFSGLGAGARGFLDARVELGGAELRFRSLGGIDFDPFSCADFEYLTKSPSLCADIGRLTSGELRAFAGGKAPDVVFLSPPCKSFSALLSRKSAALPKYQAMNQLALQWIELMLSTWDVPPKLVLFENVPRIASRGKPMLDKVRRLLKAAGYILHSETHDCGELGGLAQHRSRFLLVARHPDRCPPLLYQPIKKRVRACGEVLSTLPLPEDASAGPLHRLPKLSWLNWVRLALIPAGGDWRDLDGVLESGQARREVFRRHHVGQWNEPSVTVAGSGSNGPSAVADPRVGPFAIADDRTMGHVMNVKAWQEPASTITTSPSPSSGAGAVADPRVKRAFDHGYGVLRWDEPSSTVAGGSQVGQGAYSVADIRFGSEYFGGTYGVLSWQDAANTITGNARSDTGRFSVADPRKPPPELPMIVAADGTWHRPLTTLELAALQGLPMVVDGRPLELSGKSHCGYRERIGNAVPTPTACAIAEQMLVCLGSASAESWSLSGGGSVWVERAVCQ